MTPDQIRAAVDEVREWVDEYPEATVLALWEARAWTEMGYDTWDALVAGEWSRSIVLPRPERREVVGRLRQEGMSTRAIAAATGVSQMTVVRDLDSGETDVSPVVGTDGKTYQRPVRPVTPEVDTVPGEDYRDALDRYPELNVSGAEAGEVVEIASMIDARPEHERDMRVTAGARYLQAKADGRLDTTPITNETEAGEQIYKAIFAASRTLDRYADGLPDAMQHADAMSRDIWRRAIARLGEQTLNLLDALPKQPMRRIK